MVRAKTPTPLSTIKPLDLITPALLSKITSIYIPWPKSSPLDATSLGQLYINGIPNLTPALHAACFDQALRPLSELGLSSFPTNLLTLLPPPTDLTFPEQALGLILLLDQCPRMTCKGIDVRWVYSYFDTLAHRLHTQLSALPDHLRPDNPTRWLPLGYSFAQTVLRQFFLKIPYDHSESLADHDRNALVAETMRAAVERHYATRDPLRDLTEDPRDVYAFERVINAGPPLGREVPVYAFFFYFLLVDRVHDPVVRVFGRYPYRNGAVGRPDTEEEKWYLRKTNYFLAPSKRVARLIREDVEKGVWTPLRGGAWSVV